VGPGVGLHGFGEDEIFCACRDSNPGPFSQYLVTLLTVLSSEAAVYRCQSSILLGLLDAEDGGTMIL
jgi:hypothetical protein